MYHPLSRLSEGVKTADLTGKMGCLELLGFGMC